MQPALGKFSSAKVLIFEDVEEANSRKYPAQKFAAKEFIAQFYNDGKIINITNFLTSMVVEDITRQLKERGHSGTFTFRIYWKAVQFLRRCQIFKYLLYPLPLNL